MAGSDAVLKYITKRGNAGVADFAHLGLSRPVLFRTLAQLVDQGRIVRVRRSARA